MRARGSDLSARDEIVTLSFEGRTIQARRGESLAAALAANGIGSLRDTRGGAERGLFCGMGVCQDCLVTVDGRPNVNACMMVVERPVAVLRQPFPPPVPAVAGCDGDGHAQPVPALDPDILVVGAGAGGLSAAAIAAEAGAAVLVVDERAKPGGQYFKQPAGGLGEEARGADDPQFAAGRALIARARTAGVDFLRAAIVARDEASGLLAALPSGRLVRLTPRRTVVATGAYERPFPVPGWTLPGVMTTGALQTLLRTDRVLAGRRVVIAGNGPLNLQVALELAEAGADIVAVAEAAPAPGPGRWRALAGMALSSPGLLGRGAATVLGLRRAGRDIRWDTMLAGIEAGAGGLVATLTGPGGTTSTVTADVVGMGYGFLPASEVLRLLGCPQDYDPRRDQWVTRRDADMRAGAPGLFAVGDCCGLGGAPAAQAEGILAGAAAAREVGAALPERVLREIAAARRALARHRRFQGALWRLFAAPAVLERTVAPDTIVCRCEEVTLRALREAMAEGVDDMGSLKRATRLGMGRCQGRYCGPLAARLLAGAALAQPDPLALFAPRPPVKPVRLGALADTLAGSPGDQAREDAS